MRKLFLLGAAFVVSLTMLLTACKKDEVNKNDNNSGNTENPGGGSGGGSGSGNQEDPPTTGVIPNAVSDIDGNSYDAVRIGNQVWMAENLRTTKYADGTSIPLGSTASSTTAYRYAPGSNQSNEENMTNVATYGYLYNWPAVMRGSSSSDSNPSHVQGICPNGWHVPSDAEWTELTDYMSTQPAYTASGNPEHLAKALAAKWGWDSSDYTDSPGNNPSTNNATGFSALPAGHYGGLYQNFGHTANFWSTTGYYDSEAYFRGIYYTSFSVVRHYQNEFYGFSVRCVRD